MNHEIIIDTLLWYKIWQRSGSSPTHAKQKLPRKPRRAYRTSWSRQGNQKSITLTIPEKLASLVKNCPGIVVRQHHTDRKLLGLLREIAVRRVKEGTSAVLLQSGLDEKWLADSMECFCYLRNIQDLLSDGKAPYERRFGMPFNGPVIPFGAKVGNHPISAKDLSRLHHQFGKKVLPGIFLGYVRGGGGIWNGDISQTLKTRRRWTHQNSTPEDSMQRKCQRPRK